MRPSHGPTPLVESEREVTGWFNYESLTTTTGTRFDDSIETQRMDLWLDGGMDLGWGSVQQGRSRGGVGRGPVQEGQRRGVVDAGAGNSARRSKEWRGGADPGAAPGAEGSTAGHPTRFMQSPTLLLLTCCLESVFLPFSAVKSVFLPFSAVKSVTLDAFIS